MGKKQRSIDIITNNQCKKTPWTKSEDDHLKYLVKQQTFTYDEIAKKLQRSSGAISRRVVDLGLKDRPVKADNRTPWKEKDIQLVLNMIHDGYSYELIAKEISRSSKAIRGKMYAIFGTENMDVIRTGDTIQEILQRSKVS